MQIKEIILYGVNGKIRRIEFNLNALNIITGQSRTGKSSIIQIVRYCLGRDKFEIAAGPIEEKVAVYAVLFQVGNTQIFVAKSRPKPGLASNTDVYYEAGVHIEIPQSIDDIKPNSNDNALKDTLSARLGISTNVALVREDETRQQLELNIRHTEYFVFQPQWVIANAAVLFFRQEEPFIPLAIKDALDYFLGVIPEHAFTIQKELEDTKRKWKALKRQLSEEQNSFDERVGRGQALVLEAQQAGVVDLALAPNNFPECLEILRPLRDYQIEQPLGPEGTNLDPLLKSLDTLRSQLRELDYQIQAAEHYLVSSNGFVREATEQERRLQSIHLFDSDHDAENCPLCGSMLDSQNTKVRLINQSLLGLKNELDAMVMERPDLEKYIAQLKSERDELYTTIQTRRIVLRQAEQESIAADKFRDQLIRAAHVVGRVTYFLDTTPDIGDELFQTKSDVQKLEEKIGQLEAQLDTDNIDNRRASILNIIGQYMTQYAVDLRMGQQGPFRLDRKLLTVVADRAAGPVVLGKNMGSASDHLGAHLITLLALHRFFIENKRPVPRFLFIDQPTQTYFPEDAPEADQLEPNSDEDKIAVRRMFKLFYDFSKQFGLQIIVLDHAKLADEFFGDSIIDVVWRNGNALIPADW